MPSPFPGMDPYLETPDLWPDVHHRLISEIQGTLNPLLRPHYVARVELRVYISDEDDPGREVIIPDLRVEQGPKRKGAKQPKRPAAVAVAEPILIPLLLDDEIEEARLEIRHRESNALVTIIEVLSPTNKIRGSRGRASFMEKRRDTLASEVHWVEIDLLRGGEPSLTRPPLRPCDYRILVSRAGDRLRAKYWPVSVRQALPTIGIPLLGRDPDVPLDLNAVLRAAYDHGAYDLSVDYHQEPDPPLSAEDAPWADALLCERGLR
jgi:Protein of unknown function (DUF4058)